jgi:ribonuclease BN (tRNA processing enzyme)
MLNSGKINSTMAHLFVVGSACGIPVPGRGHSSILLSTKELQILVDAGEPCSRTLAESEFDLRSFDAVFLTHGHSDHTGGLPMLIQAAWLSGRAKPLNIFLPAELSEPLKRWLNASYLGPDIVPFEIVCVPWESQASFKVHGLKVHPVPTTHLVTLNRRSIPDRFKAYSLRIEHPEYSVVFSGDLGSPSDLQPQLGEHVDLLITEVAHFPATKLFEFLSKKSIYEILLTHLPPEWLGKEEILLSSARAALPGKAVTIASDRMQLEI